MAERVVIHQQAFRKLMFSRQGMPLLDVLRHPSMASLPQTKSRLHELEALGRQGWTGHLRVFWWNLEDPLWLEDFKNTFGGEAAVVALRALLAEEEAVDALQRMTTSS